VRAAAFVRQGRPANKLDGLRRVEQRTKSQRTEVRGDGKAKKQDSIVLVSLGISILSSLFAIYQMVE
jgi:hypothetical protein